MLFFDDGLVLYDGVGLHASTFLVTSGQGTGDGRCGPFVHRWRASARSSARVALDPRRKLRLGERAHDAIDVLAAPEDEERRDPPDAEAVHRARVRVRVELPE